LRQEIQGCEFLEYPYGIGCTQYRYCTGEAYAFSSCCRRSKDDSRSGIKEPSTVMLAYPKYVQSNLIGKLNLLDQSLQAFG
jgi:hypothetical protein